MLFLLTFVAGRVGRAKTKAEFPPTSLRRTEFVKEEKKGRSASQVVANLGVAGLVMIATFFGDWRNIVAAILLGVLAEATADTLSSEIGSAFGGPPFLLTTFQRVEPGTDGAVSLLGTLAGVFGAAAVAGVGIWAIGVSWEVGLCGFVGGVVGLGFDSLLGATVERRGWLGNDLVNFSSTVCAGVVALGCAWVW
jgi:uncharacterized protein (TIGR00297 family)